MIKEEVKKKLFAASIIAVVFRLQSWLAKSFRVEISRSPTYHEMTM
jgi:hypothetical protein